MGQTVKSDLPSKLSKPAQRALANEGITKLEQLTQMTESQVLELHGMGPKAMNQLKEALAEQGYSFSLK